MTDRGNACSESNRCADPVVTILRIMAVPISSIQSLCEFSLTGTGVWRAGLELEFWGGYGKCRLEKMNWLLPRSSACCVRSASWADAITSRRLCAFIFMSLERLVYITGVTPWAVKSTAEIASGHRQLKYAVFLLSPDNGRTQTLRP